MLKAQLGAGNASDIAAEQQIHELHKEAAELQQTVERLQAEAHTAHEVRVFLPHP